MAGGRGHKGGGGTYRIVVVEDNQALARTIAAILELELDCTVALAYDGGAALRTLVAAPVDLLLLDVALPDRDGLWLAHYVKTDPAYRELPVLIVTGAEPWPVLARLQVAHYLPKPFDFWTLVNQVRLLLGLPTVRPEPLWADEQAAGRHGTRPAQR